ncbi:MAG: transposase [Candidatus Faecivicinus sp.]
MRSGMLDSPLISIIIACLFSKCKQYLSQQTVDKPKSTVIIMRKNGVKSEARLEEEINDNSANKRFCGLNLTETAPDATTIGQNRRRRFRDNDAHRVCAEVPKERIPLGKGQDAIFLWSQSKFSIDRCEESVIISV